jgi:MarR family transcriptional regulator, organic hydroperoxide resistance regulator
MGDAGDAARAAVMGIGPSVDSEITWLLHRAAQRMRGATGDQTERHGLQLRDYIILSALNLSPGQTQVELATTLGLDKTTLMTQLDGLEERSLVERHQDPRDRRARIPKITAEGEALREKVAGVCAAVEAAVLETTTSGDVTTLRRLLVTIIGDTTDRGSCL